MATVLNQFDDQNSNQQNQQQPGQGSNPTFSAPTVGGPQGGSVATPGGGGSPTTSGGTSSGRFNNLQKYMSANQDFNQAQGGLAGQMVGNINQQAQGVQQNVQGAQNAFNQQSQQSANTFNNPNLVNQAFSNPTQFVSGAPSLGATFNGYVYRQPFDPNAKVEGHTLTNTLPGQWGKTVGGWSVGGGTDADGRQLAGDSMPGQWQAASDDLQKSLTTDYGKQNTNQSNLDAFAKIRDASYEGPKSFQDLQGQNNLDNLQVGAQTVNDQINQGQSESGRFNLLKTMFGNNNYTSGQQNLDNLLLQNNPNQFKQIQAARQTGLGLNNTLNQANQQATNQANQYGQQAASTQADVRGRLNTAAQDQLTAAQNAYTNAKTKQDTDYATLQSYLANPQGFAQSGVNPEDLLKNTTGVPTDAARYAQALKQVGENEGSFLGKGTAPTEQNVLSKEDYDKFNALNQLFGSGTGVATPEVSAGAAKYLGQEAQAGGFANQPELTFDTNKYNNALGAAKDLYNQQFTPLQQQLQAQQNALGGYQTQLQQAVNTAQTAYNPYKQMGDTSGMPQNFNNEQLLQWYQQNVQAPQEKAWASTNYGRPSNFVDYNDLLGGAHGAANAYTQNTGSINALNSKFGGAFNSPATSTNDPVADLMKYLGTTQAGLSPAGSVNTNTGARV